MTRTYKRKRWGSKERRIEAAVRLRAEGLSLREVAKRLGVSHPTVMADLQKHEGRASVVDLAGRKGSVSGSDLPPGLTTLPLPQVIQLAERRRA